MNLLGSLAIALAMYSRIPVPQMEWSGQRMKHALCFFPVIGLVCGAALVVWHWLCVTFSVSALAFACVAAALPLLITGGIHMDGFLDTTDARSSHQDRERKLEILKDPHAGAFAFIGGAVYLLLSVGLLSELDFPQTVCYAGVFVLSRALSALALVSWPKAKKDGLANTFSALAERRRVQTVMGLWILAAALWFYETGGSTMLLCCAVAAMTAMLRYRVIRDEFGGVTGDLAGYFLQLCELFLLAAVVVGGRIGI